MKFNQPASSIFVPDGLDAEAALGRTTHLAIVGHQDDTEILAIDGILASFQQRYQWFTSVIVTDGRGSPRSGTYTTYTDDDMRAVRTKEQMSAAMIGEYAAQVFLDYPSSQIKSPNDLLAEDLISIIRKTQPEVLYTHNLADKHDTHVAVSLRVIEALRRMPHIERPQKLYGSEVWRDLDWLIDEDKITFDCSSHESLQLKLLGAFESQISGGKRYDLATMGRRKAHATYAASHQTDVQTGSAFAMDLTPLIKDDSLDIDFFVESFINRFKEDVQSRLYKLMQKQDTR